MALQQFLLCRWLVALQVCSAAADITCTSSNSRPLDMHSRKDSASGSSLVQIASWTVLTEHEQDTPETTVDDVVHQTSADAARLQGELVDHSKGVPEIWVNGANGPELWTPAELGMPESVEQLGPHREVGMLTKSTAVKFAKSAYVKEVAGPAAEDGVQLEDLGPAAPGLSLLEILLEFQSGSSLAGPGSKGSAFHALLFFLIGGIFVAMVLMSVPFVGLGMHSNLSGHLIGRSIKAGIQSFDKKVLGVDIEIGQLTVNPFDGYVDCEHLIIFNPPGYTSPHLLKAEKVLLDIEMLKFVRSATQKVSVEKLVFKDITAIYEKKWGTSNVQDVLDFLAKQNAPKQYDSKATNPEPAPELPAIPEKDVEVHRVEVENFSVNLRPTGSIGEYINLNMEAGDVSYKDFASEVGELGPTDIVRELLKALLKTILSNVAGQHAAQYLM